MSSRGNRPSSRTASTSHRRTSIPTASAPREPYIIPPPNGEDPDPGNDPPYNWDDSSEDEADASPDNIVLPRLPVATQYTRQSWCSSSRSKWLIGTYPRNPATTSPSRIEVQPNQIRTTRSNENIRSLGGIIRRATAAARPRTTSEVRAAQGDGLRCSHDKRTSFIPDWEADTINVPEDYFHQVNNDEEHQDYTHYILPTSPTTSTENIQKNGHSVRKNPMPHWKARIFGSDEALEKPREAPLLHNASPYATPYTRRHTPFIPPGDIIGHENDDEDSWEYAPSVTPVPFTRRGTRDLHEITTTRHVGTLATVPETPLDVGRGLPCDSTMESHNFHSIAHARTLAAVSETPLDRLDNGKLFSRYEPPEVRPTDSVIWIEDIQSYQEGLSNDEDDYSERYRPPSGNSNDPDNYGSLDHEPPEVRPTDSVIWIEDVQSYLEELYGPPSRNSSDPDNYGSPDRGLPGGLPGGPPRGPFGNPDQRISRHSGRPRPAPGDEGPLEGVPPKGLQLPEDFQWRPQTQALPINYGFNLEKTIKISNAPQGDGNADFIPKGLDGLNHVAYRNQSIYDNLSQITPRRLNLNLMTQRGPVTELSRVSSDQFHVISVCM